MMEEKSKIKKKEVEVPKDIGEKKKKLSVKKKELVKDPTKRAVVLMSGGLDSTTIAGMLIERKFAVYPLSINYGQRHQVEMQAMKKVIEWYQKKDKPMFDVMELQLGDLKRIGGSALTDDDINVPDYEESDDIPVTYVPGRNTIFLALGLAYAEVKDAKVVSIGVNALDYSGYPDCRPEYIQAMQKVASLSSKRAVEGKPILIETPILHLTKAKIIRAAVNTVPSVPLKYTWSCYNPKKIKEDKWTPCGKCDSCVLRAKGFEEAGEDDPALKYWK